MVWFTREWANILAVSCVIVAAIIEAWQQALTGSPKVAEVLPSLDGAWHYAPLILLIIAGVSWLVGRSRKPAPERLQNQPIQSLVPGIPTLSALQGEAPKITFDPNHWFRVAYYSPLTAEVENNIKIVAAKTQDTEGFYARFIGIGMIGYLHDITWAYIFRSQLLTIGEMNRRNGYLPLSEARMYYDKAVVDYPTIYASYSFEQWLGYMEEQQLLIKHPSDMLAITHRGKDLLRYLAHWGRDINLKLG